MPKPSKCVGSEILTAVKMSLFVSCADFRYIPTFWSYILSPSLDCIVENSIMAVSG